MFTAINNKLFWVPICSKNLHFSLYMFTLFVKFLSLSPDEGWSFAQTIGFLKTFDFLYLKKPIHIFNQRNILTIMNQPGYRSLFEIENV